MYFTNLAFLRNLKNETKRQQRLRHLLVLISRMLIITALVLAFARPYIPGPGGDKQAAMHYVSIYMDNSMSMQASSGGFSLLDKAVGRALEVAGAYSQSDRFQIVTNDFESKHQPYYNRDDFARYAGEVGISPRVRHISEVFERMRETVPREVDSESHFYFISDFQRATADLSRIVPDSASTLFLVPVVASAPGNLFIDSCWFGSPYNHVGQQQDLFARLVNASETDLENIPIRLMIDGVQRGLTTFDIEKDGDAEVKITFTNRTGGRHQGVLAIDDFPVTWDDRMFFSWTVRERIPVMAISETGGGFYLNALFDNDSVFQFTLSPPGRLDYSRFPATDLIVLDNIRTVSTGLGTELEKFVDEGGSLLLIPGRDADLPSVNAFLQQLRAGRMEPFDTSRMLVTGMNLDHELFNDVFESVPENPDLPFALGHYPIRIAPGGRSDVILDLQNGDAMLTHQFHGKGRLYVMAAPAGDGSGNMARHALWVPLLYRMAMLSRPQEKLYHTIGKDDILSLSMIPIDGDQSPLVRQEGTVYEFIPGLQRSGERVEIMLYDRISEAGYYWLEVPGKEWSFEFSFNFDRRESMTSNFGPDELSALFSRPGDVQVIVIDPSKEIVSNYIKQITSGREIWKWFIWAALLFILFEILLLRLIKR